MKTKRIFGRRYSIESHKLNSNPISYTLKGPWEKNRGSFSLLAVERLPNGRKKSLKFYCSEILDLNQKYETGKISLEEGIKELKRIKNNLKAKQEEEKKQQICESNISLIEKYLTSHVKAKKHLKPASIKSETQSVWRIGTLFGNINFTKTNITEIQNILDSVNNRGTYDHNFKTAKALLKYLNRYKDAEWLKRKKFNQRSICYLSQNQLYQLLDNIPLSVLEDYPLIKEFILILYNFGLRLGEGLALNASQLKKKNGVVFALVDSQLYRKDIRPTTAKPDGTGDTKNKSIRKVIPLNKEEAINALIKWSKTYPILEEREIYRTKTSKVIKELSCKLFKIEVDNINLDDFDENNIPELTDENEREYKGCQMLRASHAIALLERGCSKDFASNQIGDSLEVTAKHYTGNKNTEKMMIKMAKVLEQNS